jgi:translation initiation factor 2 subunit 3
LSVKLKRPICTEKEVKVAITRKIGQRWRLAGFGVIK